MDDTQYQKLPKEKNTGFIGMQLRRATQLKNLIFWKK